MLNLITALAYLAYSFCAVGLIATAAMAVAQRRIPVPVNNNDDRRNLR